MRIVALAATLCLIGATASAQDEKPAAPRKHKADARALELVRKADRTTYRPTGGGLKSLRCKAEYVFTNGTRYRIAYAMEAPGRSTIAMQTGTSAGRDPSADPERYRQMLDDLFDGPRLEKRLEPYELELREVDGASVVIAQKAAGEDAPDRSHLEFRFLPDGPLAEESPGDDSIAHRNGARTRLTYEPLGDLFVRKRGVFDGYGDGSELYKYEDVGGVRLPTRYTAYLAGLGGSLTISDIEVNVAVTGPATLPPPAGPATQEELDALDAAALVAKLREPFVGKSPDPVKTLQIVRALAKKGDDAKQAIPTLLRFLATSRGEAPKEGAPADFEDFHVPLVKLLAELRPESIAPLIACLRSPNTDQRYWAAGALGSMGKDGEPATNALLAAIDDETWFVGTNAAASLRKIGCPAERALPALIRKSDSWANFGQAYADQALAFAKADPDGDRKLADALLAAPLKITRETDGRIRGVEQILKKRGAQLIPLLLEAKEIEAVDAALVAMGAAARADVEKFIASRPAEGEDAARERAKALLSRLPL